MKKKMIGFLLICCALLHPWVSAFAADPDPDVFEINIGILPYDFKQLTSSETPDIHKIDFSVDGGVYRKGKMHIRGATSKYVGLSTSAKRVPFALNVDRDLSLTVGLGNSSVKFINSFTVYRLYAEYLALELFQSRGIPTPAHAFSLVRFNNVDFGLYLAVEELNAEFANKNFTEDDVYLYKSRGNEKQMFRFESGWFGVLTSDTDAGAARLQALIAALDGGGNYDELIDVDEFLRFFACTAVLGADSSILTELNNFFLIDANGKFQLAPWDCSEAFFCNFEGNGIDHYHYMASDAPSLLFELLMRDPANKEKYHAYIREINDTFLSPANVTAMLTALAEKTAPYLARDCTIYCRTEQPEPGAPAENGYSFAALSETLLRIHENLNAQLNGETDRFYENPERDRLNEAVENDGLDAFFMQYSPTVDPSVAERICKAYPAWRLQADFRREPEQARAYLIAGAAFAGGAAVLAVSFIIPRLRRRGRRE